MDGEKRKPEANDAVSSASAKRAREETASATVTDEEVEEFFAILRRIHVAVNYFKKGNGNGDKSKVTWMGKAESHNWGRNVEANGGKKKGDENVEENHIVGLDLNADPGTGSDPF
ncbi:hypothetical protein CCACVL1_07429 [Corchorus capsularis]|uniref:Uncharacterized protein n=1 Tax=Corchorus capsularis TaxID=210143 RepID=A0A1R3J617_COCAP|nr:hypothetical protein CCACVL1_07429 [Corchorus capsularis]